MDLVEAPELSRRFPAERFARVRVTLRDGRVLASGDTRRAAAAPRTRSTTPSSQAKYRALATPVLGPERAARVESCIAALGEGTRIDPLLDLLLAAP